MPDSWNEPPPQLDDNFRSRIIQKTDEYLSAVNWKQNGCPATLREAVELAKQGLDGGKDLTMSFRPNNYDFHDWMMWNSLVTYLFNRDTQIRTLLSAFRKDHNTRLLIYMHKKKTNHHCIYIFI